VIRYYFVGKEICLSLSVLIFHYFRQYWMVTHESVFENGHFSEVTHAAYFSNFLAICVCSTVLYKPLHCRFTVLYVTKIHLDNLHSLSDYLNGHWLNSLKEYGTFMTVTPEPIIACIYWAHCFSNACCSFMEIKSNS
jgi:hypothetical protein